jgi:outer membrane protein OmpA-like peptidoglycan-associated protein
MDSTQCSVTSACASVENTMKQRYRLTAPLVSVSILTLTGYYTTLFSDVNVAEAEEAGQQQTTRGQFAPAQTPAGAPIPPGYGGQWPYPPSPPQGAAYRRPPYGTMPYPATAWQPPKVSDYGQPVSRGFTGRINRGYYNPTEVSALVADLRRTVEERESELEELRATLKEMRLRLSQTRLESQQAIEEWQAIQARMGESMQEKTSLQAQQARLTQELEANRAKLAEREQALADSLKQAQEFSGTLDARTAELMTARETLNRYQNEAAATAQQHKELEADIAARDERIAELQRELHASRLALQTAGSKLETAGRTLEETGAQARACRASLDELNTRLKKAGETRSAIQQSLSEAATVSETMKAELVACTARLGGIQGALSDASVLSERLQSELDARTGAIEAPGTPAPEKPATKPPAQDHPRTKAKTSAIERQETADRTLTKIPANAIVRAEIAWTHTADKDTDNDGVADNNDLCPATKSGVPVESSGCAKKAVISLDGVNFHHDSYDLTWKSRSILNPVAQALTNNPRLHVEIAGHTDKQGEPTYNDWLSQKRAESVRDYLVKLGVNPGNLKARGYGSTQPVYDSSTRTGMSRNRRVELRLMP